MYFSASGRGRGQDVWRDIESASRDAVNRLRDLFENVATETAERARNTGTTGWTPAADLTEDTQNYYAHIELPGTSKEKIEVLWKGDGVILVKGKREETLKEGETQIRSTRSSGPFEYRVQLPDNSRVNDESITARYADGVLTITIEKAGSAGTTIEVA